MSPVSWHILWDLPVQQHVLGIDNSAKKPSEYGSSPWQGEVAALFYIIVTEEASSDP